MSKLRIAVGVVSGFVFVALSTIVISPFGLVLWYAIERYIPALSGVTKNTNTDSVGKLLLLPLVLSGGIICAALIIDPKMSNKVQTYVTVSVFLMLMLTSGFNFWSHDALIHQAAQAVIDIALGIFAFALIGIMLSWNPSLFVTSAIQRVGLFFITIFGFILPLFYATKLLLYKFGYPEAAHSIDSLPDWMKFFTTILGFAAALFPSVLKRSRRSLLQKP